MGMLWLPKYDVGSGSREMLELEWKWQWTCELGCGLAMEPGASESQIAEDGKLLDLN
jgi:hypothetical protein